MPATGRAHVFTQAYGSDAFRAEALYLALTALAWREGADPAVHVYTDAPELFAPVADQVEIRVMSQAQIRSWRGRYDFTHRLKPLLIQDMARRFPDDTLLYLDADTYLVGSPEGVLARIGAGRSVMHAREQHLQDRSDYHMRNFSRRLRRLSFRGVPIPLDAWMWNAGAVGLAPEQFPVIERWIAFIDEVWPRYRRGLVEQYGIAMLLQQSSRISGCDDYVVHYWYQKDEYLAAVLRDLALLRTRPLGQVLDRVRTRPAVVPFRVVPHVRLPVWKRWRRSLLGER